MASHFGAELRSLKAAAQQHEEALSSVQISKQDMAVSLQHLQTELALAQKEQQLWREKYTDIKRTQEDRQKEDQVRLQCLVDRLKHSHSGFETRSLPCLKAIELRTPWQKSDQSVLRLFYT